MIRLAVKDTGRGIHEEDIPHIFDRFYQTKQNQKKEGGSGIGLAICRELAELLNGKIWAESQFGEGSKFVFEFPKIDVIAADIEDQSEENQDTIAEELTKYLPAAASANPDKSNGKITILLVEDNHHLRQYISLILSEHGYEVISAMNGEEALERLDASLTPKGGPPPITGSPAGGSSPFRGAGGSVAHPQLIISDLMMPVMDGFQLVEKLKSDEIWHDLPVIMLTARSEMKDKLKALRIGVDDYLIKPFENEELLARVENLIRNKRERAKAIEEENEPTNPQKNTADERNNRWLEELENTILENIHETDFNLQTLAFKMHQSNRQLYRNIKRATGLSPHQYLKEVKFQYARRLLEDQTFQSVKEVAGAIGVKDVKYFSQQFKIHFGKLPSEYLNR